MGFFTIEWPERLYKAYLMVLDEAVLRECPTELCPEGRYRKVEKDVERMSRKLALVG